MNPITTAASAFVAIWNGVAAEDVIVFLQYSWVVGHLLGYVLLGSALWRARVIPRWAAGLIIIGVPLQMVAYPTHQGLFQHLGFALECIGSIPAARAMFIDPKPAAVAR